MFPVYIYNLNGCDAHLFISALFEQSEKDKADFQTYDIN